MGDRAQLQKLIQFTLDTFGGLDVLVSNAAVNPASGPIMTMEVSWRQLAAAIGGQMLLPGRAAAATRPRAAVQAWPPCIPCLFPCSPIPTAAAVLPLLLPLCPAAGHCH